MTSPMDHHFDSMTLLSDVFYILSNILDFKYTGYICPVALNRCY